MPSLRNSSASPRPPPLATTNPRPTAQRRNTPATASRNLSRSTREVYASTPWSKPSPQRRSRAVKKTLSSSAESGSCFSRESLLLSFLWGPLLLLAGRCRGGGGCCCCRDGSRLLSPVLGPGVQPVRKHRRKISACVLRQRWRRKRVRARILAL
ncbi:hypothetical protein CONLIGDRAFT_278935 [Coniochaeta ligniaria NRRL 30616]|uniref:Uncharacterized protein n=1 Tax=Coniochaeta ligniaria NRRL 30616 TaxID=1408157 RepID=A0A1J7I3Q0_9PEZI|nr:hypothetical protein CONLIGDRAFT_278935 [Coniochaeta ligniaria NRRL 30616]